MGDVIPFKKKEDENYWIGQYAVDSFTIEWENYGVSYQGTLQFTMEVDDERD